MIAVAGATGTLGSVLLPILVGHGEPVRIMTRDASSASGSLAGVEVLRGDVTMPADAKRLVAGARVVISAITGFGSPAGVQAVDVAGNRALAEAATAAGVERFILLSILGATADHPIELFRAKAAAERIVRASGVPSTFIRPTAYLETWLGLLGGPLVSTGKTRVFGQGRNPINFVSALDVARFVDLAVTDPAMTGMVVDVPGPADHSLDELVGIVEAASGRTAAVSHTPRAMMRVLSVALRPFASMRAGQVAAALVMDTADMSVDGQAIRARYPAIPMTTAEEVAGRMFGGAGASDGGHHRAA